MKYDSEGNLEPMSDKETVGMVRRWVIWGLIALVVIGGVGSFVAWDAGWWFSNQNVNRQAIQFQHSYGTQTAYIEEVRNEINQFTSIQVQRTDPSTPPAEVGTLTSQAQAIINQACGQIGEISITVPKDEAAWSRTYCSN